MLLKVCYKGVSGRCVRKEGVSERCVTVERCARMMCQEGVPLQLGWSDLSFFRDF